MRVAFPDQLPHRRANLITTIVNPVGEIDDHRFAVHDLGDDVVLLAAQPRLQREHSGRPSITPHRAGRATPPSLDAAFVGAEYSGPPSEPSRTALALATPT